VPVFIPAKGPTRISFHWRTVRPNSRIVRCFTAAQPKLVKFIEDVFEL
jgi:hypothetical protein